MLFNHDFNKVIQVFPFSFILFWLIYIRIIWLNQYAHISLSFLINPLVLYRKSFVHSYCASNLGRVLLIFSFLFKCCIIRHFYHF